MAIAQAFNIKVNEFFSDEEAEKGNYVVFKSPSAPGSAVETLATNLKAQNLNPVLLRLSPKDKTRKEELATHPGDEFIYCLSGEIECQVGGDTITLSQGEAITYKAEQPHLFKNLSERGSNVLIVFELNRTA